MRDIIDLRAYWLAHVGEKLALCTIVRKKDSGYRQVGAKKIVRLEGGACGLLSGGCLEGEIERVARARWQDTPFIEQFSTAEKLDRLLGYQAGCAGTIDILFETLPAAVTEINLYLPFGEHAVVNGVAVSLQPATLGRRSFTARRDINPSDFFDPWIRPINLFIIGCGADAPAFAELARPLGWSLRFLDYRSDFTLPEIFSPLRAEIFSVDEIATKIPANADTAVMLMTHNYEADTTILAGLNGKTLGYLGCLGPGRRYDQMKTDLRRLRDIEISETWEKIVYAPAGIFNGTSPQEIALSVIAQIQAKLSG